MTQTQPQTPPHRASLEVLRAEANDERSVLIAERLRQGQDPWDFIDELPTVDEFVVLFLRADYIAADHGARPSSTRNYRIMRQIALDFPPLTGAVWHLLGDDVPHRLWALASRLDAL